MTLRVRGPIGSISSPAVAYEYTVAGQTFQAQTIDYRGSVTLGAAVRAARFYRPGRRVTVYYDPDNPLHTRTPPEGRTHAMPKNQTSTTADEAELRRLVDELFITTDLKDWTALRALFVDGQIEVDMSSLAGGGPMRMTADQLVGGFRSGLHAGKVSHHLAANYRIAIDGERAEILAHGYAWNHVPALPEGSNLWETWGDYRLTCGRVGGTWRLDGFRYYSKLTRGNDAVRTHTA